MVVNINGNWIKLFTKFITWEWYKDHNTKIVFIHCLLKANWKEGKFEGKIIPRGSFVTSRKKLAQELGLTEQEIRTALKHLISTNEITVETTNKYTAITIIKYEDYQHIKEKTTNEITNETTFEQPATNQQLTTIEEYKNIEYKNNSVCNTHARDEKFNCHLGSYYKSESCFKCMKKYRCPLSESSDFRLNHSGQTFKEWNEQKEKLYEEWCQLQIQNNKSTSIELFDYDWLNDEGENDGN